MQSCGRRGLTVLLSALMLALGACGGSSSSSSTTPSGGHASTTGTATQATRPAVSASSGAALVVSATAGAVRATMHAASHRPTVEAPWPVHFTVTAGGRPARAGVSYEYLFGGAVVARRSHYTFTGSFSDIFKWPASAVGYPLTFRAVIVAEGATINLDYPVQVLK